MPGHRSIPNLVAFWGTHVACLLVVVTGARWSWAALAVGAYLVRIFAVTAGYHRYFSHRAFRTSRAFQFALAVLAQTSGQKGVLWWAAHHRHHHRESDRPGDRHSPAQQGFWHSHAGWILDGRAAHTETALVPDLSRYPELRFLDRWHWLPSAAYIAGLIGAAGLPGFAWGWCISTTLLWHGTFTINSLSHMFGRRPYATGDDSRNNLWLALLTLGEGWHNNHHRFPGSAAQGFVWWQIDVTWLVLRACAAVGLVSGLTRPPAGVVEEGYARRRHPARQPFPPRVPTA